MVLILFLVLLISYPSRAGEEVKDESSQLREEIDWEYIFNVVLVLISLLLVIVLITKLDFLEK